MVVFVSCFTSSNSLFLEWRVYYFISIAEEIFAVPWEEVLFWFVLDLVGSQTWFCIELPCSSALKTSVVRSSFACLVARLWASATLYCALKFLIWWKKYFWAAQILEVMNLLCGGGKEDCCCCCRWNGVDIIITAVMSWSNHCCCWSVCYERTVSSTSVLKCSTSVFCRLACLQDWGRDFRGRGKTFLPPVLEGIYCVEKHDKDPERKPLKACAVYSANCPLAPRIAIPVTCRFVAFLIWNFVFPRLLHSS